jgi:hypothetical protein
MTLTPAGHAGPGRLREASDRFQPGPAPAVSRDQHSGPADCASRQVPMPWRGGQRAGHQAEHQPMAQVPDEERPAGVMRRHAPGEHAFPADLTLTGQQHAGTPWPPARAAPSPAAHTGNSVGPAQINARSGRRYPSLSGRRPAWPLRRAYSWIMVELTQRTLIVALRGGSVKVSSSRCPKGRLAG